MCCKSAESTSIASSTRVCAHGTSVVFAAQKKEYRLNEDTDYADVVIADVDTNWVGN